MARFSVYRDVFNLSCFKSVMFQICHVSILPEDSGDPILGILLLIYRLVLAVNVAT